MTVGKAIIYLILTLLSASIVIAFWHLLNLSLSPSYIATRAVCCCTPGTPPGIITPV